MRGSVTPRHAMASLMAVGSLLLAVASACNRADAAGSKLSSTSTPAGSATSGGSSAGPVGSPPTVSATVATNRVSLSDTLTDSALIAMADRGRLMGRDSGAMWLVMVSDFQCPYCKQWHDSSMAAVKRDYVDPGKVRIAYLNLPLPQHPHARMEAEAGLCAAAQSKFWPYSEALFRDQDGLNKRADIAPYLDSLARANAIDMAEFARCRRSRAIADLITSDMQQANRAGIKSTPSFLVGQFLVEGASPYPDFRRAIDTALLTERKKRSR